MSQRVQISMSAKIIRIAGLLRLRDELVKKIQRIDQEIEGDQPDKIRLRGSPPKYTKRDITHIRKLFKQGKTQRAIAKLTGIPHSTVGDLLLRHR